MSDLIAQDLKQFNDSFNNSGKPMQYEIGTYMEDGSVMTDQSLPLKPTNILISQRLTDYELDVEIEDNYDRLHTSSCPGGHGDCTVVEHKGKMKVKIYNHLEAGDKVWLLRQPGGQRYLIVDRVKETEYKKRC